MFLAQAVAESADAESENIQSMLENAPVWLAQNGMNLVIAIIIFFVGKWVAGLLTVFSRHLMEKSKMDDMLVSFLGSIVKSLLMLVVIIAALNKAGFPTTSLVAIVGAAGLAVAFALQSSLANFASGVMIILFKPFTKGNFISAGGETGIVEDISIFTTLMKTPDNKQIIVPNGQIMGGSITNFSAKDTRRIDLVFGISYDDSIKDAKDILNKVLEEDSRILKDPAPTVGVLALADSSVNFAVRPWVNAADYWDVFFHLNEEIKNRFDAADITIPYPQQDVHMHQVAARSE